MMLRGWYPWVLGAALMLPQASQEGAHSAPARTVRRSGTQFADEYVPRPILGFDVRFVRSLDSGDDRGELGARVAVAMERDLGDLLEQLPSQRHAFLRSVPIFVGVADPVAPCACYHPSAQWLARNGFDPRKAGSVEIASAATFLDWRGGQPSMLMHELAHAFHDQVLGKGHPGVIDALAAVRERGVHDSTLRNNARVDRHYALSNADEYFAETTESLFGVNDFYPFVRAELLHVDREGAALVAELWGAPLAHEGRTAMSDTETLARVEVARLHAAFEAWFRATEPGEVDGFASIEGSLAKDFRMVTPDGQILERSELLERLRAARGKRDIAIRTRLVEALRIDGEHMLAVYEEQQVEDEATSTVVSTALLAFSPDGPDGILWLRVHETRR